MSEISKPKRRPVIGRSGRFRLPRCYSVSKRESVSVDCGRGQILDFLTPTVKIIREVVGEMYKSVFRVSSLWKTLLIVRQGRETEMRIEKALMLLLCVHIRIQDKTWA